LKFLSSSGIDKGERLLKRRIGFSLGRRLREGVNSFRELVVHILRNDPQLGVLGHVQVVPEGNDQCGAVEVGNDPHEQRPGPVEELSPHRRPAPSLAKVKVISVIKAFHRHDAGFGVKDPVVEKSQIRKQSVHERHSMRVPNRNNGGRLEGANKHAPRDGNLRDRNQCQPELGTSSL
jgi:hypothetical protein